METALSLYAGANLLLFVGFLLFALLPLGNLRLSLRIGQLTVAFALLAPPLFHWLPRGPMPAMPETLRVPLAEMATALTPAVPAPARSEDATLSPSPAPAPAVLNARALALAAVLLFLLGGWTVGLLRLRQLRGTLRSLLENATPIKKIGRVTLVASPDITVPLSTWLNGRAWVALPDSMLGKWSDFKVALWHELQHHRQRDTAWALAIEFFTFLLFWNPAIYFWKRRIHELQELTCDEALIGRKISSYAYGSCLVRVAEAALGSRQRLVGTTGMATGSENPTYFKSFLRRRIEMLAQYQPGRSRAASFLSGIILFLTLATLAYGANQKSATLPDDVAKGEVSTDPAIQKIAETALEAALTRHKASLGFVVVSDPHTGRVLAVANQDRMEVQSERTPHWALALRIGPASIAKAIVAAAAVEKGVTTYGEVHNCEKSKYRLGGQLYQDWKAFDKLTTADTVVHSSNICGIKVGQRLGADGLAEAFKAWGFGPGGTADGFPESRPGILPTLTAGDQDNFVATYSTGYGGNYTTAMETVQAFGAIANGGQLLKPQSSKTNVKPEVIRRVLSEENAKLTRAVLADVMVRGTAKDSASKQYELAGKTATGYSRTNVGHDTLGGDSNMAAFIGFGPVNSPRVVVLAVVENPTDRKGVHGSYHAAPLFKEVAEKTLRHLKVAAK